MKKGKYLSTLRLLFNPIIHVGVSANERKCESGNQYQNCENTNKPTMDGIWFCPARDCKDTVALRPPYTR